MVALIILLIITQTMLILMIHWIKIATLIMLETKVRLIGIVIRLMLVGILLSIVMMLLIVIILLTARISRILIQMPLTHAIYSLTPFLSTRLKL